MPTNRSFFTSILLQKYTQHLLSGTPAFHDHAHVGVRSHAGATSNQSPCRCKGMSGVPLTSDIIGGPSGATRTSARHLLRIGYAYRQQIAVITITTRAIFFVTWRQRFVRRSQPLAGKVT